MSDFANMTYLEYPLEDMTTTYISSETKAKIFKQNGADYLYYGHAGNNVAENNKNFFIVDPIVMLPTTYAKENAEDKNGKGMFYDMIVPDFVVGVTLTFDYTLDDGSKAKALFTKRFVPQTKIISTSDLKKKKDELQKYVNRKEHQRIGSLTINHSGASDLLRQFFSSSNYIINNK